MILSALKLKLAPYALALKIGLLAVVFLLGLRTGCSWQADRDAEIIADKDAALVEASVALKGAAIALNAVNANTAAEVARAKASEAANAEEAAKAKERAEDYRDRLSEVEADLEEAKRQSPACRARLEERPCAELR